MDCDEDSEGTGSNSSDDDREERFLGRNNDFGSLTLLNAWICGATSIADAFRYVSCRCNNRCCSRSSSCSSSSSKLLLL